MTNFETARRLMVDTQVRPNDVTDVRIQDALLDVRREAYLPAGLRDQAYMEKEISYAEGRSLITARDFAKLLAALAPKPDDIALAIGVGSGYAAAVLAALCEMVVAVESEEAFVADAQENWTESGVDNAAIIKGDLNAGAPSQGPFDAVLIASAVEEVPETLLRQLKDEGRLAAIVREDGVSRGFVYVRAGDAFSRKQYFDATARGVLPGFEKPKVFAF